MLLQQFQVMQGVKVKNDKLEAFGHAGHVVGWSEDQTKVEVRIDSDNEVYEFDAADLETL